MPAEINLSLILLFSSNLTYSGDIDFNLSPYPRTPDYPSPQLYTPPSISKAKE